MHTKTIKNYKNFSLLDIKFKLCLFLFCFYFSLIYSQEKLNFLHLEQNFYTQSKTLEDHFGYIWITGSDGMYKYDGYDFSYTPYQDTTQGKYASNQKFILEKDNNNNLWVAPYNGCVSKFNNYNNKEQHNTFANVKNVTVIKPHNNLVWFGTSTGLIYKYNEETSSLDSINSVPKINNFNQIILSIAFTGKHKMWISTDHGKIYRHILNTDILEEIKTPLKDNKQNILLESDSFNTLWIATESEGLYNYTTKDSNFTQYDILQAGKEKLNHALFISLFCDSNNNIWAGTDGDGLYKVNATNKSIKIYKHDELNKFSITNNTITHINEDSYGNIWVVAKKGEINILPNNKNNIAYYNGLENSSPTTILSSLKASDGSLWIGTDGKGLTRVTSENKKEHYNNTKKGSNHFSGRYIQGLVEDAEKNIWIATYLNGLWKYNTTNKQFSEINARSTNGVYSPDFRHLFKDNKNRIWVSSGAAINVYNASDSLLATFDYNKNNFIGSISQAINQDKNGTIWIGLDSGGLYELIENKNDFKNSTFKKHSYNLKENPNHTNFDIIMIQPDYNGSLWILTNSGFLLKYNTETKLATSYLNNPNLEDIDISALLLENSNSLWLSSKNGIHNYLVYNNDIKSYYKSDGFQGNSYLKRSAHKDKNGNLYFGGEDGLNSFSPSQMQKSKGNAKVYINAIDILNKPAHTILENSLQEPIEEIKELNLDAKHSSLSFQFSAIENVLNSNYHYAYKLKGFDDDWITAKKDRTATYTNIPSGNYTFIVKAGTKKGEWDITPKSIDIYIKPPIWNTYWAYLAYLILGILFIIGIFYWLRLKKRIVKETWQNEKEKELYAVKMNFFAKMSHEIQTPLTLILGPIDDMLRRADSNGNGLLKQRLFILKNNAKRLSRIANELMTVRNRELGILKVLASKNNIIDHAKEIALSFTEQARFKNINFTQHYSDTNITFWYDRDKIEHILYNLLSNAFKFTPKEGNITLEISAKKNECIKILVSDSGPGIPKDELDDIFKLFYQSELGKNQKGLGVGLALTKELISLHHGKIYVKSSAKKGTSFIVKLPIQENVLSKEEKLAPDVISKDQKNTLITLKNSELDLHPVSSKSTIKKHTLLLVEDNIEMQIFLKDILKNNYHLLLAENGKEGILLAEKNNPDLIISDIMMPVMNGLEMCKTLQKNKKTQHIPIILLTAKNSSKSKLDGLKSGAVVYIEKPFNLHELILKVNNIISSREKIISKYKTDAISTPNSINTTSKDDLFIKELVNELNKQLDNTDFKLEDLPSSLNMSYSVIYRKCQDITGKTLVEFLRSLRLKKAAILICEQGYNISEAAYMVGYKDTKYFTKCFKDEFGKSPSVYKKTYK